MVLTLPWKVVSKCGAFSINPNIIGISRLLGLASSSGAFCLKGGGMTPEVQEHDCSVLAGRPCTVCRRKKLKELVRLLARIVAERDYNALLKQHNEKEMRQ